jgi:hypothetical protein
MFHPDRGPDTAGEHSSSRGLRRGPTSMTVMGVRGVHDLSSASFPRGVHTMAISDSATGKPRWTLFRARLDPEDHRTRADRGLRHPVPGRRRPETTPTSRTTSQATAVATTSRGPESTSRPVSCSPSRCSSHWVAASRRPGDTPRPTSAGINQRLLLSQLLPFIGTPAH